MKKTITLWMLTPFLLLAVQNPAFSADPGAKDSSGEWDETIRYAGQPAELSLVQVSERTIEVQLSPIGSDGQPVELPSSEVLIDFPRNPIATWRTLYETEFHEVGNLRVEVQPDPLRVVVRNSDGDLVQSMTWDEETGAIAFNTDAPVFGLGHGGPQFDRRGNVLPMRDGWGAYRRPTHGSRVSAPMIIGSDGWSMFVHHPISSGNVFDLEGEGGLFIPDEEMLDVPLRFFLTAWDEPVQALSEYRLIAGETPMPPLWSLGYMQSHRTLESTEQLLQVAYNFRARNIPADAVIYLGTGFTPSGWNRGHGNFEFNEEIFDDPEDIFRQLKELNFNVVLHTYAPPRGLHGSSIEETSDEETHIRNYWLDNHESVFDMGVDGWWPDGGEPLSSESRVARYRMYWQGPLYSRPNTRPWNINRTGYSGAHRYGGWIWSGDPDSYWETLKTQIAVGLNHSVSLTPYWGSDTGGFLPSRELTGELYVRWLQFSAFTASMRSHGRAWHLRLPWGWNTANLGPAEVDAFSDAFEDGYPFPGELRNAMVEPIAREYLQLRYRLLPYSYTLTRDTYDTGMPPMRALWLHYPDDPEAVAVGDQFLWGRDIMVAPVYEQGVTEWDVYLPEGLWLDYWTNEKVEGGRTVTRQVDMGTMPLYVRAGAMIPHDPVRQYTAQEVDQPTMFHIYDGADGTYRWYRDDGSSQDYENGEYSWTLLNWNDDSRELTIEPDPASEGRSPEPVTLRFRMMEVGATAGAMQTLQWDGTRTTISFP
ncbi:MAG: TIM-barrel domain-containing protein [Balneolaceae bacterium]